MAKRLLAMDIGSARVALAEYTGEGQNLTLVNYGTARLATALDATNAETVLGPALGEICRTKGIKPGPAAVSVSGQSVFPRFAAIPAAGGDEKFEQMVRFEIEQNIPFPIDEMVCDRQVVGESAGGDKEVLIVASKLDMIEAVTRAVEQAGFSPTLISAAPIALVNAFRVAQPEAGCSILLDIGAKTSSLIIVESEKIYNRSIPVAGNTITKEISTALQCTKEEAEQLKKEHAYVAQGGVVEDEDETLDRISKICRAVMTRLNAEISRSVNFYRGQQGGGTPAKLYLTGGTSLLPKLDEFFAEALGIEVEYFNPFETIAVGATVDADALESEAAMLASVCGLGMQVAQTAPLSISLLPPSLIAARAEKARIPFVAAGSGALVLAALLALIGVNHQADVLEAQLEAVNAKAGSLKSLKAKVEAAQKREQAETDEAEKLRSLLMRRGSAVARINAVRQAINPGGGESDIWIEKWHDDKVSFRGWKDRVQQFTLKALKDKDSKASTAPEIVVSRMRANPAVVTSSPKVTDMSTVGKNGVLEQFSVEVNFK